MFRINPENAQQVDISSHGEGGTTCDLIVVSPMFNNTSRMEERNDLVYKALEGETSGLQHFKLRAWTPEEYQIHRLDKQAPAHFEV